MLSISTLFFILIGTVCGIVFGAMPGLTSTAAVALLIPLTYSMNAIDGMGMILGAFCGGTAGGAIPATLLNIPGTPSSICTTFDGYPMVKNGKAGLALGTSLICSFLGGIFSFGILVILAPFVAEISMKFGPLEYFLIVVIGMLLSVRMMDGLKLKAMVSLLMGILFSFIGSDPITGMRRLTFGSLYLSGGIKLLPIMIGLFAISQVLIDISDIGEQKAECVICNDRIIIPRLKELFSSWRIIITSSIIGCIVGILPGTGGSMASMSAYTVAKQISPKSKEFGNGCIDGIIASEVSNNAMTGGALIPTLALGIPGEACTSVMLGGMALLGIRPGPSLFINNTDIIYSIFIAFLAANVIMFITQFWGMRVFIKLLSVPKYLMVPMIFVLSTVGTYCAGHDVKDLYVMLFFGFLGYGLKKFEFGIVPLVMGVILGALAEKYLRTAIIMYDSVRDVFNRPIVCILIIVIVFILLSFIRRRKKE